MTLKELEQALRDESISDEEFFKILLRYFDEQEKQAVTNPPNNKEIETQMNHLRKLLKIRPTVIKMLKQHVLKQHEHCCGPQKSKK